MCIMRKVTNYGESICQIKRRKANRKSIPKWCPIKEIPPKMEELKCPHSLADFERKGFARGWNDAIQKIERIGD